MNPSGGPVFLPIISTEEILYGGPFSGNTSMRTVSGFTTCKRSLSFSFGCTNALKRHGEESGVAGLRANEGYPELEKLYASIASLFMPFFIFGGETIVKYWFTHGMWPLSLYASTCHGSSNQIVVKVCHQTPLPAELMKMMRSRCSFLEALLSLNRKTFLMILAQHLHCS